MGEIMSLLDLLRQEYVEGRGGKVSYYETDWPQDHGDVLAL